MFKSSVFITLISIGIFSTLSVAQADSPWKLRKNKKNIQVYTKKVTGSPYNAVKTTTIMKGVRLSSMVALIQDSKACAGWAPKCAKSYLFKQISEKESLVYTHNDMPFPVTDRDVLARVIWSQDPNSYKVTMTSVATVGLMAKVKGKLRLTQAKASWTFTPLKNGSVEVSTQAHINPGSSLPGWITNMLLVSTPYQTMRAFMKAVVDPKYQTVEVSFIHEPPVKGIDLEELDKPDSEKSISTE